MEKYPWWVNDVAHPVHTSICRTCKFRDYKDNGYCNYLGVTHQLKPVNSTTREKPYCQCYEEGEKIASGKGITVKKSWSKKDG